MPSGRSRVVPAPAAIQTDTRSFPVRHPVWTGVLIGTGAALAFDAAACSFNCGFATIGAGLGMFAGLIASAKGKPSFNRADSGSKDVEQVIRALGPGERIVVSAGDMVDTPATIVAIAPAHIVIDPHGDAGEMTFAFTDVRAIRKKPLGAASKAGLVVGALAVVGVALGALCLANGYCSQ